MASPKAKERSLLDREILGPNRVPVEIAAMTALAVVCAVVAVAIA